jgi:hypothetical protein
MNQNQNRPQHNLFQDLSEWIGKIPQITRYLFIGTLSFSVGAKLGLCSVLQLLLLFEPLYERYQIWRLFTAHLFTSGQGLIWHLYLLYQQSKDLETGYFGGKAADYFFVVLQSMLLLDVMRFDSGRGSLFLISFIDGSIWNGYHIHLLSSDGRASCNLYVWNAIQGMRH